MFMMRNENVKTVRAMGGKKRCPVRAERAKDLCEWEFFKVNKVWPRQILTKSSPGREYTVVRRKSLASMRATSISKVSPSCCFAMCPTPSGTGSRRWPRVPVAYCRRQHLRVHRSRLHRGSDAPITATSHGNRHGSPDTLDGRRRGESSRALLLLILLLLSLPSLSFLWYISIRDAVHRRWIDPIDTASFNWHSRLTRTATAAMEVGEEECRCLDDVGYAMGV